MNAFGTLFKREMQAIFLSPLVYIFAVVILSYQGFTFVWGINALTTQGPEFSQQQLVDLFFGGNIFYWFLLIAMVTALTMRLFAEEKRSGTLETLLTAPVTDLQVVLAKYLGALAFFVLLCAPTALYFAFLGARGLDLGLLAGAYTGLLLLGALYVAVGCLISSACTNQVVAAILTFVGLAVLSFLPLLVSTSTVENEAIKKTAAYLNFFPVGSHSGLADFNRGLASLGHVLYPLSGIVFCLFLACRILESRSWK